MDPTPPDRPPRRGHVLPVAWVPSRLMPRLAWSSQVAGSLSSSPAERGQRPTHPALTPHRKGPQVCRQAASGGQGRTRRPAPAGRPNPAFEYGRASARSRRRGCGPPVAVSMTTRSRHRCGVPPENVVLLPARPPADHRAQIACASRGCVPTLEPREHPSRPQLLAQARGLNRDFGLTRPPAEASRARRF